ncbi:helix-turn-helix domain-containing protein [Roseibium sp.]|uniref:helix-turn-helix domain-containing protein n=1 Tax=Roseibium sp. TaxID=1936156 RepID=UPI003B51E660
MTDAEFKAARKKLGLTQPQLARILAVNLTTVQRFEMSPDKPSASKVNPTAARVMDWMLAGYRPPEFPT